MTDYLAEREREQADAVLALGDALDQIEQSGRDADLWERVALAEGISAVFRGLYGLAVAGAIKAMTPGSERSPSARLPTDPIYDRFNLDVLRRALEEAKAQPVLAAGFFGPVVLSR